VDRGVLGQATGGQRGCVVVKAASGVNQQLLADWDMASTLWSSQQRSSEWVLKGGLLCSHASHVGREPHLHQLP
jgi:ascorbate-specific PTS system EIIC-type component UlaA